jgi:hypothetical protein
MKRILVISDMHCGHLVGLTPPSWRSPIGVVGKKIANMQDTLWEIYTNEIDKIKPIDILIVNGDAIDGKGKRSGSTELITPDTNKQVDMAAECINYCEADKIVMTYGTPYHVSDGGNDDEDNLAEKVGAAEIGSHGFYNIDGFVFSVKHKPAGSSAIPHGEATPLLRDWLANLLWKDLELQPKADVIIRSHVHKYLQVDNDHALAFSTPALQGFGSKYGSRQCTKIVSWGFVYFDISDEGELSWKKVTYKGEVLAAKVTDL